jgi:hypothetical protein
MRRLCLSLIAVAASVSAALVIAGLAPAKAAPLPGVAILNCRFDGDPTVGILVSVADASAGAPAIEVGSSCAEALALLGRQGFTIRSASEDYSLRTYTLVR